MDQNQQHRQSIEGREHEPGEATMTVMACVIIIVVFTILALIF